MNAVLYVLIIVSGAGNTTTTTVVGKYPAAVCQAMANQHNRLTSSYNTAVRAISTAYCNAEKKAEE